MAEDSPLVAAERNDVLHSLSFALTHDHRRRFGKTDSLMATIVAEHLLKHLEESNYVIMRRDIPHGNAHAKHLASGFPLKEDPEGEPEV